MGNGQKNFTVRFTPKIFNGKRFFYKKGTRFSVFNGAICDKVQNEK